MIPRLLHRIWLGSEEPAIYRAYRATFETHFPGLSIRDWDDRALAAFPMRNRALFDAATDLRLKADIARYEILWQHGGVYVDTDVECVRSFDDLLDGPAFAGQERDFLAIGVLGAPAWHPFFDAVIEAIPASIVENAARSVTCRTGPVFFTRQYNLAPLGLHGYPQAYFYPYLWDEPRPASYPPETRLVHHWGGGKRPT